MTALLAHRGASAEFPENTLLAFRRALEDPPPADGFECDVRLSADGVPFVFHDDTMTRLANVEGSLESRTAEDIAPLRVTGEPIPTLDALLALTNTSPPLILNIELKPTGHAGPLITACRPLLDPLVTSGHSLVVSSFDPRVIAAAFDAGVPWRMAFLYEDLDALNFLPHLDTRGALDLHPHHPLVDADHLTRYHTSPFDGTRRHFRTWTVDDPTEAQRVIALGIDAIITNVPQRLRRSLDAPQSP